MYTSVCIINVYFRLHFAFELKNTVGKPICCIWYNVNIYVNMFNSTHKQVCFIQNNNINICIIRNSADLLTGSIFNSNAKGNTGSQYTHTGKDLNVCLNVKNFKFHFLDEWFYFLKFLNYGNILLKLRLFPTGQSNNIFRYTDHVHW